MSDLLSAASLFLAVLGMLYATWHSEIVTASSLPIPIQKLDRRPTIAKVRHALNNRAIPLAAGAFIVAGILTKSTLQIIGEALMVWSHPSILTGSSYDPVKALFCAIYGMMVYLAIDLAKMVSKLLEQLMRLTGSQS
jgi:hypothetical protein